MADDSIAIVCNHPVVHVKIYFEKAARIDKFYNWLRTGRLYPYYMLQSGGPGYVHDALWYQKDADRIVEFVKTMEGYEG